MFDIFFVLAPPPTSFLPIIYIGLNSRTSPLHTPALIGRESRLPTAKPEAPASGARICVFDRGRPSFFVINFAAAFIATFGSINAEPKHPNSPTKGCNLY